MRTTAPVLLVVAACATPRSAPKSPSYVVAGGEPGPLACAARREDRAIQVDDARAATRRGLRDAYFSDRETSPERPIELCGFAAQYAWLERLACDDGSRPLAEKAIERGQGGLRRSEPHGRDCPDGDDTVIIDLWTIACPEREYTVHIDQYVCAEDELVMENWPPRW